MTESWVQPNSVTKPKRGYWYIFHEDWCPLCMRSSVERERVYDSPKPLQWHERHIIEEVWDHCDAF